MTPAEIYSVARSVGFPPDAAVSMVAIALKESGGNPRAHNPKPPDDSYGLWQVNMIGNLGVARRREFGLLSNTELFDPYVNGRAALAIWGGNNANLARHWYIDRGHNRDRYLQYLPTAEAAAREVEGVNASGVVFVDDGGLSLPAGLDKGLVVGVAVALFGLWWITD